MSKIYLIVLAINALVAGAVGVMFIASPEAMFEPFVIDAHVSVGQIQFLVTLLASAFLLAAALNVAAIVWYRHQRRAGLVLGLMLGSFLFLIFVQDVLVTANAPAAAFDGSRAFFLLGFCTWQLRKFPSCPRME